MPKAYSIDLRQKIITAYENKEGSMRGLAKRFKVSFRFIYSLLRQFKQTGSIAPKPHGGGYPSSINVQGHVFIKNLIENQPDLTLEEIQNEYNKHFESVSKSTIDRTLIKLKITRKKRVYSIPEKRHLKIRKNKKIINKILRHLKPKILFLLMKRVALEISLAIMLAQIKENELNVQIP